MAALIPFLILVIGVVIWVIVSVVRSNQEQSKPVQRRTSRTTNPVNSPKVERNSTSDIDRFLMEIDRLRKKDPENATSAKPAQSFPQKAKPPKETASRTKPVSERDVKSSSSSKSSTSNVSDRQKPVLRVVSAPAEPPRTPSTSATSQPSTFPESNSRTSSVIATPELETPKLVAEIKFSETKEAESFLGISAVMAGTQPKLPKSPVADLVRDLMKSQKGKAAAVILGEIFGPPPALRK